MRDERKTLVKIFSLVKKFSKTCFLTEIDFFRLFSNSNFFKRIMFQFSSHSFSFGLNVKVIQSSCEFSSNGTNAKRSFFLTFVSVTVRFTCNTLSHT